MNRATAENVHSEISKIFELVNAALFIVNNADDMEYRKRAQRIFGMVLAELDLELLEPVYKQFPDLRPPNMIEVKEGS